jgi:hypothetical protein
MVWVDGQRLVERVCLKLFFMVALFIVLFQLILGMSLLRLLYSPTDSCTIATRKSRQQRAARCFQALVNRIRPILGTILVIGAQLLIFSNVYTCGFSDEPEWPMRQQLDESLDDLSDGLDVLHILEKAFAKTLEAHVVATSTADEPKHTHLDTGNHDAPDLQSEIARGLPQSLHPTSESYSAECSSSKCCPDTIISSPVQLSTSLNDLKQKRMKPLMEGSSTAILAVLEHPSSSSPPVASCQTESQTRLFSPQARQLFSSFSKSTNSSAQSHSIKSTGNAVLRVAHLGDCMAMLVRGDYIVWRTEEMWWNVSFCVKLLREVGSPFLLA